MSRTVASPVEDQSNARKRRRKRRPFLPQLPLTVPHGVRLRISPASFWKLCCANRDMRLERTARGELIVMPPAGSESGLRNSSLTGQLWYWAHCDETGFSFDSSAGFTLPNTAVRAPDAAWIRRDRWEQLTPEQRREFAPICPDFVVELVSESDRLPDARKKMREYLEQGVRLGWVIDPIRKVAEIYRPGREVEIVKGPMTLSGEDVLIGFELDLKPIFA